MGIKIIRPRQRKTVGLYCQAYRYASDRFAGFSFPCDKNGIIQRDTMQEAALANLEACERGEVNGQKMVGPILEDCSYDYTEPAIGICENCGAEVSLDDAMTNDCEGCGALYNGSGQRLKPVQHWFGEDGRTPDTGETAADIFGPQDPDDFF